MQSTNEGEDTFFDANEDISTSADSLSPDVNVVQNQESWKINCGLWTKELMSVQERRNRFLMEMGFYDPLQSSTASSQNNKKPMYDLSKDHLEHRKVMNNNFPNLDTTSSSDIGLGVNSFHCIRDLDSGKEFVVHNMGRDGESSMFREIGSDKLMTLKEFEKLLGLSHSVQKFLRREVSPHEAKTNLSLDVKKKKSLIWWRNFTKRKIFGGNCKNDVSVKSSKRSCSMRIKVHLHRKRCMELSALYMGQEIHAHDGLIRTMKFSPCGRYLASGGEDCVLRIWQIKEVGYSCACLTHEGTSTLSGKVEDSKVAHAKYSYLAPVVIPKRAIRIGDIPLHELEGHTSDILDISWSNSGYLLTSSKDKTVRLWKVGLGVCLKVFQHNNYVTCVQFNPVDDTHFISGSIDGKVRIWGVTNDRVVDWVDTRDIITAICYKPDGKGFVVGSLGGSCRFYNHSASSIQLDLQLHIGSKRKSAGKRITGLQFSPKDSKLMMVTSADSKVQIFYGFDVFRKFKGLRRAKSQFSAEFTSDGRHIISVGEDSHIYIWNSDESSKISSRGAKSTQSCEFFSEDASFAVPWPGMNHGNSMLCDSNSQFSSLPRRLLEPHTWLRNPDCFSLGAWLFSDGSSRVSPTLLEDKLPLSMKPSLEAENCHKLESHLQCHYQSLMSKASTWSLVIVTARHDGTIRSFHNYGLPLRL